MAQIIKKNLNSAPAETRKFEKGKVDIRLSVIAGRRFTMGVIWI